MQQMIPAHLFLSQKGPKVMTTSLALLVMMSFVVSVETTPSTHSAATTSSMRVTATTESSRLKATTGSMAAQELTSSTPGRAMTNSTAT
jgi:hypothetical protein